MPPSLPSVAPGPTVLRIPQNPIVRPEMLPGTDGANINGPSLIRVPEWVERPLGRYYLYFAHHQGTYIRLAFADRLEGPWRIHTPGVLHLADAPGCHRHIASPDILLIPDQKEIRMYFHGPARNAKQQMTFVARSTDGLHFTASDEPLCPFYFRAFRHAGWWYGMSKGGLLWRSSTGLTGFEEGPNPMPDAEGRDAPGFSRPGVRHVAVQPTGQAIWVYYSSIGDAPERILRSRMELTPDWTTWKAGPPQEVLSPEEHYEGIDQPIQASLAGAAHGREHALRDPALFSEGNRTFLIYSVAGESGLALAEIVEKNGV